jgi:hypothetical protein
MTKNLKINFFVNIYMPIFTKEDFLKPEVGQKLSVIIMSKMNKNVLTLFSKLINKDKKEFNKYLNEYIASLGEDWEETLTKDFNETCTLELFDTENFFKAENIPTQVGECELILTEEQKQFEEDMKDPMKKALWEETLKAEILEAEKKAIEEGKVHIIANPEETETNTLE